MILREELARRLYEVWAKRWEKAQPVGWEAVSPHVHEDLLAYADETIRQMEWARRDGYDDGFSDGAADAYARTGGPLTLAPEDWKP